jgi:hypothetical protein
LRVLFILGMAGISACSWFGSKTPPVPEPTELVVTGLSAGSTIFVDGVQVGTATAQNGHPLMVTVAPGPHTVEIHSEAALVYREDTYVGLGESRVVAVLSGLRQ